MKPDQYLKLKLDQRYQLLSTDGEFIASRFHSEFNIHLFALYGFYVEMYQRIGLADVVYIEVQTNKAILNEYALNIDLKKDLGLDI